MAKVELAVGDLKQSLQDFRKQQATKPKDWGYAGSAYHVAELLAEILLFMNYPDYGERDGKAVRLK